MQDSQTLSFTDIIRSGFQEQFSGILDPLSVVVTLALSLVLGLFVFFVYKKTFAGVIYSRSFNLSLIMVSMVTTLVMIPMSANIGLSLGMVGALSIVRFRTAVKDAIDTIYMFWSIAIGICLGANFYGVALVGSLMIAVVMVVATTIKRKTASPYLLILHHHESISSQVRGLVKQIPGNRVKSRAISRDGVEMTVEVRIRTEDAAFVDKFMKLDGMYDASLISYQGDLIS
jgi:hypothetical protein